MTLAELSNAWNTLRDRALGRAASPTTHISKGLADRVGREFDEWRTWYLSAGPLADIVTSVSAGEWVARYNVLAADLRAEGIMLNNMDTPVETVRREVQAVEEAASDVTPLLLLVAAYYFLSKPRR